MAPPRPRTPSRSSRLAACAPPQGDSAPQRKHVPESAREARGDDRRYDGRGRGKEKVRDEQDRTAHAEPEEREPDDSEAVRDVDYVLLVLEPELDPVVSGRGDQQDRGDRRTAQRHEIDVLLERGGGVEPLLERDGQEEREEHLHAGERDAQLPEELGEIAVYPLVLGLLAPRGAGCYLVSDLCHWARCSQRAGDRTPVGR